MEIKKMVATTDGKFQKVDLVFYFKDGGEEHKTISFSEYLMSIQKSVEVGKDSLNIGKLPNGYYDSCINMNNPQSFKIVLTVPGSIRLINYYGDSYAIPFPHMAFFIECRNGKKHKSLAVALKAIDKEIINDDVIVCNYPFGNVHQDYEICWGQNDLKPLACIKDAEQYIAQFFSSETNNDLYNVGFNVPNIPEFTNQRGLIEALVERDWFPNEWLVESDKTLGELVREFLI